MKLYPDQEDIVADIHTSWENHRNTMAVMPTGSGKTVVFSHIIQQLQVPTCAIAHRKELVTQMAMSLARYGVNHRVIGPSDVVKQVVSEQVHELGTSFYNPNARVAVAGIDTLIRRGSELSTWLPQVKLWVIDEAHHLLRENKWGTGIDMFPNARGLGVTATPIRADGKGLGRHSDGVFDDMVEGLTMRQLIDLGRLTDYRVFAPPSDIDLRKVPVTQGGEFSPKPLKTAVQSSHVIGDVVEHYLRIAKGKKGITFATDVETATLIAQQFKGAGVRAEVISADTPGRIRTELMRRLRNGELDQLVNVDLFGEGLDLPGIEVVSMARPTASYGLYCQQFGRALRLQEGKKHAIIIDHVGNVVRHGLPDKARVWSLDGGEKRPRAVKPEDDIPLIACTECTMPYEKIKTHCPYCGHKPVPISRGAPEFVDGDLYELDAATLAEMRGQVAMVDDPSIMLNRMARAGAPQVAINSYRKNSVARLEAQTALRESIAWWGAHHRAAGKTDPESYKLFYHLFSIDILSAQALGRPDAIALANKINEYLIYVY